MAQTRMGGGPKVWGSGAHCDGKTGKLIWSGHTRSKWWLYFFGNWDVWRTNFCEKHRTMPLPQSFRTGDITPASIVTSLLLGRFICF